MALTSTRRFVVQKLVTGFISLLAKSTAAPGHAVPAIGDVVDVEGVAADPRVVQRPGGVDRRGQEHEVARRRLRSGHCGVQRAQRPADAPSEQAQLVGAGRPQDLAHPPRQRVADVVLEAGVRVLVVGHAPVEQVHVEALVEEELDERMPRPQVEHVRPVDQREHQQHRQRMRYAVDERYRYSVVLRCVHTTSFGVAPITASSVVSRTFAASTSAAGARAARPSAVMARSPSLVAQRLELLQHPLELVLGPVELPAQPDHVRPPGEPQIAQRQVEDVVADLRQRDHVLGHSREEHAERLARDHLLECLG